MRRPASNFFGPRLRATIVLGIGAICQLATGITAAQTPPAVMPAADAAQVKARLEVGQRIYREGIGASGLPLKALGAGQAVLGGSAVACAVCHRRSGYGTSEGQFSIRPITGPALFEEQTLPVRSPRVRARLGSRQRAPYTEALLARAIRSGVDSTGSPLATVMPRYVLSDDEVSALTAYLQTLSAQHSPGVNEEDIHFATVIQPGIGQEQRRAMLDIMEAFVRDKGANMRSEERRRDAGNMRMYRAYRKWILDVWDLSGPSETWGSQLEAHYRKQPVFALIGGLGNSSWQPIHDFSERLEIPSVFPQVDLPVVAGSNDYNFYFSRGVTLEAEVLAKFFRHQVPSTRIVQVYRRAEAGLAAAAAFKRVLQPGAMLQHLLLEGPADESFWQKVLAAKPDQLVLWLGAQDLEGAGPLGSAVSLPIYLSSGLLGGRLPPSPLLKSGANVHLVYPSDLPPRREARLLRTKMWLHSKGIGLTDEAVQINTQFAMTVASDAVGHIADSFSRDYFVERIEHVVSQTPAPSVFQSVSLGPGQRFAAKGMSIVRVQDGVPVQLKAISPFIVP